MKGNLMFINTEKQAAPKSQWAAEGGHRRSLEMAHLSAFPLGKSRAAQAGVNMQGRDC